MNHDDLSSSSGGGSAAGRTRPRPAPVTTAERAWIGAFAGIGATIAMTMAMRAMHRRLPARERYPLPPREIIQGGLPRPVSRQAGPRGRRATSLAAHFGYGAATGALYALSRPEGGPAGGSLYGVLVWAGSYFGLMPALGILQPAQRHPLRRNMLMIGAHVVWGATLALSVRELERAQRTIFSGETAPDRAGVDFRRSPGGTAAAAPRYESQTERSPP